MTDAGEIPDPARWNWTAPTAVPPGVTPERERAVTVPVTAPFVQMERPADDPRDSDTGRAADGPTVPAGSSGTGSPTDRRCSRSPDDPGSCCWQLLIAGAGWWSVVATLGGDPATLLRGLLLIVCLVVAASATVAVIGCLCLASDMPPSSGHRPTHPRPSSESEVTSASGPPCPFGPPGIATRDHRSGRPDPPACRLPTRRTRHRLRPVPGSSPSCRVRHCRHSDPRG